MTTHNHALSKFAVLMGMAMSTLAAHAQEKAPGIIGKNGWFYYNHEFVRSPEDAKQSIDLIAKAAKVFEANGTTLLIAMAPIKSRIYPDNLPDSHPLTADMKADYDNHLQRLKAAGVNTVDINSAFLKSDKRMGEFPFYFRQDTHWSATGAMAAAEAIRDAIKANPVTQQALAGTPETRQNLLWATQKFPMTGDLMQQLPPGSPTFDKELITAFEVIKVAGGASLLGDAATGDVALVGSSYTAGWTQFPKAVEFALQRTVPSLSLPATIGQWYGMDTYLRNDAFQTARPKLLIWEMPERDMKAPPSMPYREARYVLDNQEWLARVSALLQQTCTPSAIKPSLAAGKLASGKGLDAMAASTTAQDGLEINLAQSTTNQEYLSAKLMTNGSKTMQVTLSGPGATARQFTIETAGDDQEHTFKIPLFSKTKGFNKIRLAPGDTKGFSLKGVELCQQPAGVIS